MKISCPTDEWSCGILRLVVQLPLDDPVVASLFEGPNLARLAYNGEDGRPRVVPIWFTLLDGDVVMVTGPKAAKVRALEANPPVALTIDDARPPYKVLLIEGDASLEHIEGIAPEYEGITRRYLGAAADAYLSQLRIKRQVRIRVLARRWRIFDFVKRYPQSLR
jgi:PPOX class probable F420-dependent enzyme